MMPPVVASPNAIGRGVEVAPRRPALGPRRRGRRVHAHAAHPRQVDHDAVVAGPEPRHAVPAAADGEIQPVLAREVHRRPSRRRRSRPGRPPRAAGRSSRCRRRARPRSPRPRAMITSPRTCSRSSSIGERPLMSSSFAVASVRCARTVGPRRVTGRVRKCRPSLVRTRLVPRRMAAMPIAAHLLGPPLLVRDGVVYAPPRGKKVWALLAYLALSERQPTQPAAADRPPVPRRRGPGGRPALEPVGAPAPAGRSGHGGERQRGAAPAPRGLGDRRPRADGAGRRSRRSSCPGSAASSSRAWTSTRAPGSPRGCSASAAGSRRSARRCCARARLRALASGNARTAVELATRLVAADPLNEDAHVLLVRAFAGTGDEVAVERQLAASIDLFRRELGVEPGPGARRGRARSSAERTSPAPASGRPARRRRRCWSRARPR